MMRSRCISVILVLAMLFTFAYADESKIELAPYSLHDVSKIRDALNLSLIDDDINVYNIHSIDDSTFYVQFEKTYPTDSTSDGYGYAVVHMDNLDDQHFTIWELGWDTESISEQSLAAYKN